MSFYIYILIGFVAGFIIAWLIQLIALLKIKKEHKSAKGLLESEKLIKENAQKENRYLLQSADSSILTTKAKLKQAEDLIKIMDVDILLLQKSNEETEALLAKGEPAIHELKLKLIEANNVIARYKSITGEK
ncbi:MAG: LapA family protein [Ferruginibacter sp.]|nr:LapA family protein [Ferruginibacter sp.]